MLLQTREAWSHEILIPTNSIIGLADIICMDLQIPNVGGFESTKAIRSRDKVTPIIALSAAVLQEDVAHTSRIGMNAHIGKPIIRKELITVLQRFIKT